MSRYRIGIKSQNGDKFSIYDGNSKQEAMQAEHFAELLVDKSTVPLSVTSIEQTDEFSLNANDDDIKNAVDYFTLISELKNKIIENAKETLRLVTETTVYEIDEDDIINVYFVKHDKNSKDFIMMKLLITKNVNVDTTKVGGIKNEIFTAQLDTFTKIVMKNEDQYYRYSYWKDERETVLITPVIEVVWRQMEKNGYDNSYISYITSSNLYEIETRIGLKVDQEYAEHYEEFMINYDEEDE